MFADPNGSVQGDKTSVILQQFLMVVKENPLQNPVATLQ